MSLPARSPIAMLALKFWNAAMFSRHAPNRDQTMAKNILVDVSQSQFPTLRARALDVLEDFHE